MFATEDEMIELIIPWLERIGLKTYRSIRLPPFEIDLLAYGKLLLSDEIESYNNYLTYSFEVKIASTRKLQISLIEQGISRLLMTDIVYLVVPETVETWVNGRDTKVINPPKELAKFTNGPYSRYLGIISLTPSQARVYRKAKKSNLVIPEIRRKIVSQITYSVNRRF